VVDQVLTGAFTFCRLRDAFRCSKQHPGAFRGCCKHCKHRGGLGAVSTIGATDLGGYGFWERGNTIGGQI